MDEHNSSGEELVLTPFEVQKLLSVPLTGSADVGKGCGWLADQGLLQDERDVCGRPSERLLCRSERKGIYNTLSSVSEAIYMSQVGAGLYRKVEGLDLRVGADMVDASPNITRDQCTDEKRDPHLGRPLKESVFISRNR